MQLYIDADGCPVTRLAVKLAAQHRIPCTLLCDTAHSFDFPEVRVITVSKGADSADFALVRLVQPGDLVVTQDYGLAAMCLSRGAIPIHQDGMVYTNENIDGLLFFRAAARRVRAGGGRLKGSKKRTKAQDDAFAATLCRLMEAQCP